MTARDLNTVAENIMSAACELLILVACAVVSVGAPALLAAFFILLFGGDFG